MGMRIGRGTAVHAVRFGDSATLCGMGADMVSGVDEKETCKRCLKMLAKEETEQQARDRHFADVAAGMRLLRRDTAAEVAKECSTLTDPYEVAERLMAHMAVEDVALPVPTADDVAEMTGDPVAWVSGLTSPYRAEWEALRSTVSGPTAHEDLCRAADYADARHGRTPETPGLPPEAWYADALAKYRLILEVRALPPVEAMVAAGQAAVSLTLTRRKPSRRARGWR